MEELPDPAAQDAKPEQGNALSTAIDAVAEYLGDIPVAIKKNLGKALGHLFRIPGAYIDGIAAEIRAESDARVLLTKTAAKKIASQMEVDQSLAKLATSRHASKILRQQVNAAKVMSYTVQELNNSAAPKRDPVGDITDDWLNAFESEAVEMSSEQMQRLFGRILAGEIRRPKSFSIRTVKLMAQLDNRPAELFRRLCSLACTFRVDANVIDSRVPALGTSAAANGLQPYGLGFDALNLLFEYGLIISDFNSYFPYVPAMVADGGGTVPMPFEHQHASFALVPSKPLTPQQRMDFKVHGVGLSQAGRELLGIVEIDPDEGYTKALVEYFGKQGFTLVKVAA
jgi:hypothetical protein